MELNLKSRFFLAVLGVATGAAWAQGASVTLFGVVDLNLRYVNNDAGSQYQMSQDGMSSSRLGVRGVEDLGGGLDASFWIEGSLNPDNGTALGQTWTRRSTVSLSGGGARCVWAATSRRRSGTSVPSIRSVRSA